MDAQTQLVAELYKTLNDAQKQEVCNMIDTLLGQRLHLPNVHTRALVEYKRQRGERCRPLGKARVLVVRKPAAEHEPRR